MKAIIYNTYNSDIDKNAIMNWRTNRHEPIQNMIVIADGYFQSAILNAKICLIDNDDKNADVLIFPMIFNVNHGIELYLKALCWALNILLEYKSTYKENHDIRGIWLTTKQKIKEFGFNEERPEETFNKMSENIDKYLNELANVLMKEDKNKYYENIDFSRYPTNNRHEYHFYLKTFDNVTIDLEQFVNVFSEMNENLNSLCGYYYSLVVDSWQSDQ